MNSAMSSKLFFGIGRMTKRPGSEANNLANAQVNKEHVIKEVKTSDEELKNFLFTLGCYAGEKVTVLSILGENYVISVKDARYSIDKDLAKAIAV